MRKKWQRECHDIDFTTTERDQQLIWYLTLIGYLNKLGWILSSCQKNNINLGALASMKYFTFFLGKGNR